MKSTLTKNAKAPKMASSRNAKVSKKYQKKSHLEHIMERPDTYVGSTKAISERMWVVTPAGQFEEREISYVPGLFKIFDEILVNAADNKQRDPNMGIIEVNISDNSIMIKNDGKGIPVEMHAKHKCWVPQMVFGELLTGDNYDDSEDRVVGGRNGYGAKLANIFSTSFVVETVDSQTNKIYSQSWTKNMTSVSKPSVKSAGKRKDFTRVTFSPDFRLFGLTGFDDDHRDLFRKRVYDIAGTVGVRVNFNGVRLKISNFKQYCELYLPPGQKLVHEKINDRWEVCVTMAPDQQPKQVSFCNSICTTKGGQHVQYVANAIAKGIVPNRAFKDLTVKPFMVTRSTWIFVRALIVNPTFDSQTKESLTTRSSQFGPAAFKPTIEEAFLKRIVKQSGILEEVKHFAVVKSQRNLQRATGGSKKKRVFGIPKLDDASLAGGIRSQECTLILTEGDSAKALAIAGLSVIGRQKYGVFPLKGKLLNVRDASNKTVIENAEIQNIMKIMGLNIGTQYTDTSRLRYGHVMIMTDQDHDGSHIKGLLINFLHHFWPSLLRLSNFLQVFITPIVKCTRRGAEQVFYTTPEFDTWQQAEDRSGWRIKYYKGLGTSSAAEAKAYFRNLSANRIPFRVMNDAEGQMIDMCFRKKRTADRKGWIGQYTTGTHVDFGVSQMPYSDFVNKEYVIMAVHSNMRGIPHVMDGLKPSQRKILFACLKRKLHSEIKVAQLAGYTSEHAAYHHGEASLNSTIIGMAQTFVGSNNIHLLEPNGQFGTRLMGGKDAASPRYVFTQLSKLAELVFHPDDAPLYTYLEDDGLSVEPVHYMPVLPLLLVNGACGIGTGWSTTMPSYNPKDVIRNLREMLAGRAPANMLPWYRDFEGTVSTVTPSRISIRGVYTWKSATVLFVSELPVGTWTNAYKEKMERSVEGYGAFKKGDIVSMDSNHTDTTISFTFKLSQNCATKMRASEVELVKAFRLETTMDLNNMHAFDTDGRMKKYDSTTDILNEFFPKRLALYGKRKEYQIGELTRDLSRLTNKVRFLEMVVAGDFSFRGRRKPELIADLDARGFVKEAGAFDYLLNQPLWNLTTEKLEALRQQRSACQLTSDALRAKTPQQLWSTDLSAIERQLQTHKRGTSSQSSSKKRKK